MENTADTKRSYAPGQCPSEVVMRTNVGRSLKRALIGAALCTAIAAPLIVPGTAQAWWYRPGWGWRPGVVIGVPPVVVAPAPVYVAPPVVVAPQPCTRAGCGRTTTGAACSSRATGPDQQATGPDHEAPLTVRPAPLASDRPAQEHGGTARRMSARCHRRRAGAGRKRHEDPHRRVHAAASCPFPALR